MKKNNKIENKFKEIEDEELVFLAQKDIDIYRSKCYWECPSCGFVISYIDSLLEMNSVYVHEMKCINIVKNKKNNFLKCNTKMSLKHSQNIHFDSNAFNELFVRYNGIIKNNARKFNTNTSSCTEDVYSSLCLVFFKAVAMFSRSGDRKKTSNRWFQKFLNMSMKNKMVDMRKSLSYIKKNPTVKCACSGKEVGQITVNHLKKECYDIIFENLVKEIGMDSMKESGEIFYYTDQNINEIDLRSKKIGEIYWNAISEKEKEELFKKRALKIYSKLYPNSYVKNNILSTNESIGEENDLDLQSQTYKKNDFEINYENKFLDEKNIDLAVNIIMENTFKKKESIKQLNYFFKKNYNYEDRIKIIKQIIRDKISYLNLKNVDSDKTYEGIGEGLTSALFRIIKNDNNCKEIIKEICLR